ncbi:flavin reductase family protein [Bacillus thermotolerans]|uniref:Nitrilotriacetate monooxygenase component B n=1 Tax=Bacillus thermotolerans TaxID=1221996 RepID=A0A0F5HYB9_BACTR|nr:flavin reductase family protein [Bacillus thermotolerans]KKB38306.1 Nitrilotriacetate monooxygenase component B [Bacillus thermotolerans]KKB39853.1 Nitrilotriacetate monooxygenase component B [Bacillus thermotolerans]KKB44290.1 Nitrilotriacetate monooxygenase component B [Bacillus thermotolerans]
MFSIDPSSNSIRENYKLLIGSIVPRPIAFVTTQTKEGVINGAPFSYFSIVSADPPMLSVAVQRTKGIQKDTARNAIAQKEFVVHIVDEENVKQVNETAAMLPPDKSEVEASGLQSVDSTVVSVPGVKEAKIRMECVLEHVLELGGGEHPSTDLLIGKIVQFHINEDVYENGKICADRLKAVSRLAGNDYAKIGDIFTLERPK